MYKRAINIILASTLTLATLFMTSCQQSKNEPKARKSSTFTEMADPMLDSVSQWTSTSEGLNASFVSTNNIYDKSVEPKVGEPLTTMRVMGWQGERLSAQILLWTTQDIKDVEFDITDFQAPNHTLPSSISNIRFVRYVMTDKHKDNVTQQLLAADILDNINIIDIDANTVRPLWVSITIPQGTPAGTYTATIEVKAKDCKSKNFNIEVEVQNEKLPEPSKWTYHLDLKQHPAAVARTAGVEVWSEAHFEAMKPLMKMLANASQKVITTTLNKDPWNNQAYDAYPDMITWTKNEDSTWTYDYTIFDKWVQFMINQGITKMINCYSVLPYNNDLHYLDTKTNEYVTVQANPGTEIFNELWHSFFASFKEHLSQKGWLNITNIALNKHNSDELELTLAMLQKEAPELGITYTDNQDGFSSWSYNAWTEYPLRDSRLSNWPAGDTYMVYPDARSSIRFEKLVEGIQSIEKIKILRNKLAQSSNPKAPEILKELDATLATFKIFHPDNYVEMLDKAKALLNKITNEHALSKSS
ncbi:DUF4091 domain-containing protein [Bacteroides propionicifaciens]|uniref:DUF4091 domain-containing protein n=1 Tax=Bacteroides propionicifaciens TaxID=392838 RepID=UPI00036BC4F1|nr:DUF4091 domain-containing protein [Bacteroides propionicifaciens]